MDADTYRSASHLAALAHLAGPFPSGARTSVLALDASGAAAADGPLRHPLLLAVCRRPLGATGIGLTVAVSGSGAGLPVAALRLDFAPWTEAGAALPVFAADPLDAASENFPAVAATVALVDAAAGLAAADAVELHLVEGLTGRVLYACSAEKQRLRRQARELVAARTLATATDDALDRHGADLGVPRLADALAWDAATAAPTSMPGRESDAAYRRRLALFRPLRLPTAGRLRRELGGDADAPGLLAALGLSDPLVLSESNADLAVAVRLVSSGPNADFERLRFLRFVRATYLVMPGAKLPTWSLLPQRERATIEAMLARLAGAFVFPAKACVARYLGEALDRLGRARAALGAGAKWTVLRAQDDAGGSRFELGLGAELAPPLASELDAMAATARSRSYVGTPDFALQRLLDSLAPQDAAADPLGRWLLSACGLRSVHPSAAGVYVSHLPVHALQIDLDAGSPVPLHARLCAPGDGPLDARLFHALQSAQVAAAAAGLPAWTALAAADAPAAWALTTLAGGPAFARAGLRAFEDAADVARTVAALADVPAEAMATLRLDATLAASVIANADAAVASLAALLGTLRDAEVATALAMGTSDGSVLLLVAFCELPGPAISLNQGPPGFTWTALGLRGTPGVLAGSAGARNAFTAPATQALSAIVVVTAVRADREDPRGCIPPYQVQVDAPSAATRLDLPQFEFLMNLLRRALPLGVVMDSLPIRASHVDPAGSGTTVALTGMRANAWRAFRQRRSIGLVDPGNQETPS